MKYEMCAEGTKWVKPNSKLLGRNKRRNTFQTMTFLFEKYIYISEMSSDRMTSLSERIIYVFKSRDLCFQMRRDPVLQ